MISKIVKITNEIVYTNVISKIVKIVNANSLHQIQKIITNIESSKRSKLMKNLVFVAELTDC
jgi:uncharacterized BrkB/YihY/UPF0761 family membrane protein